MHTDTKSLLMYILVIIIAILVSLYYYNQLISDSSIQSLYL